MKEITDKLLQLSEEKLQKFSSKLVPNIDPSLLLGVRIPDIRALAKQIVKDGEADAFLQELPHRYIEEYTLHGAIVSDIKDFDKALYYIERLLPYIDNWMTCDVLSPKVFGKNPEKLLPHLYKYMESGKEYTVRFGMKMLMTFYLDKNFSEEHMERVVAANSDYYYVRMMTAWYFATALAKQYDAAIKYIEERRLERWTHNKAIQKAIESYRITDEQKLYLRTLKVV